MNIPIVGFESFNPSDLKITKDGFNQDTFFLNKEEQKAAARLLYFSVKEEKYVAVPIAKITKDTELQYGMNKLMSRRLVEEKEIDGEKYLKPSMQLIVHAQ
jgi:hypothetical protein